MRNLDYVGETLSDWISLYAYNSLGFFVNLVCVETVAYMEFL
jgi:hypothetical protein